MTASERLGAIVAAMPPDSSVTLPIETLREWLGEEEGPPAMAGPALEPQPLTWRERLWIVPPETRIGVRELAEATGRSRDWCYRRTARKAGEARIPHRKLDGELVFVVGEVREWIRGHEDVICEGRGGGLRAWDR